MNINSIEEITNRELCIGCTICEIVCPTNAIKIEYNKSKGIFFPLIEKIKCKNCGICKQVCPVFLMLKEKKRIDVHTVGRYYIGYSKKDKIRSNGASGGIVTAILSYLLSKKLIDFAIVSEFTKPFYGETIIIDKKEKLYNTSGSLYCPVYYNKAYSFIKRNINQFKNKSIAIVGLPCQIKSISNIPWLRSMIKFKISLICGQTVLTNVYTYLSKRLGISLQDETAHIKYRTQGWPGGMKIKLKNGKEIFINYNSPLFMKKLFSSILSTPLFCQLCIDPDGREADISIGDAWSRISVPELQKGVSIIKVKSKILDNILSSMQLEDEIELIPIEDKEYFKANRNVFRSKLKFNIFLIDLVLAKRPIIFLRTLINKFRKINLLLLIKLIIISFHLKILQYLYKKMNRTRLLNSMLLNYFKLIAWLKKW